MRNLVPGCLVFILLVSFALPAHGKDISKKIHKSFDVSEGARLRLKHGDGDVTIQPWDRDVLDVSVVYKASYKSIGLGGKRDFDVIFEQRGDLVEVIGKEKSPGFAGIQYFNTKEYTYTIKGPRYLVLLLEGDDGNVEVADWQGNIECFLDDGDVTLENINSSETRIHLEDGDVRIDGHGGQLSIEGEDGDVEIAESNIPDCTIHLEDGDIAVGHSEGNFEINVDDGNIELSQMRSNMIAIESEDGEVDVELVEAREIDLDIRTEDGDVTVRLPDDISAAFTINVDDGTIEIEFPAVTVLEKNRRRISGEIRAGRGRIRIKTSDGDVVLRETE